ncbi:MAG: YdbL family protein [Halieaceae bacterium]|jgi:uncharacterized protein|nr:YdbL family protein [Halieaceae bacterium]
MKRILLVLCLILVGSNSAFAMSLKDAKSGGLIGERNDGYVGYVVTPPSSDVKVLVKDVNNKRRARFASSAKKNSLQTDQVGRLFYERAVKATAAGHYYQDTQGNWVKK